jgi:hypothetical protein
MSSQSKVIGMVVLFAAIVSIPAILLQRRAPLPNDKVSRLAITAMTGDLRGLILAQEATKRLTGRYEVDPEAAGHLSSLGVTKPVIILSDTGWSATVGYKTVPEIRCAVAVYNRNPLKRFAKSGEIVCE